MLKDLAQLEEYRIPLNRLKGKIREFEFTINHEFFEFFQEEDAYRGNADVKVIFRPGSLVSTLDIELKGSLQCFCDRCLDDLEISLEGKNTLYLKWSESEGESNEDMIFLSESDHEINIAHYIYELFELNLPLTFVHPDEERGNTCNENMIRELNKRSVNQSKKIDPRWSELQKLKNK